MSDTGTDTDCTIFVTDNGGISNVHKDFDLSDILVSSEDTVDKIFQFVWIWPSMVMYMYILIIITNLVLTPVIHYKYTFILQSVTQATDTNHTFGDTAIDIDYFVDNSWMTCWKWS